VKIITTFTLWRYWFRRETPEAVLDTFGVRTGARNLGPYQPYTDVYVTGAHDRRLTMMELRYSDWIEDREFITYTDEVDDGL
jgi:hypothetical protein